MPEKYANMKIIGCDETGVGDYLTPLVACAVYTRESDLSKIEHLKIKDSKTLSDTTIVKTARELKKHLKFEIAFLSQKGYNKLNKSFNAHELKMFLHLKAINAAERTGKDVDLIIVDQFANERSIKKYYAKLLKANFGFKPLQNPLKLVEKGENEHVAVAAASVLARDFFLSYMQRQNQKWGMNFPLGTNQVVEEFAKTFVKRHGMTNLQEVAKLSFKTTRKLFGNEL